MMTGQYLPYFKSNFPYHYQIEKLKSLITKIRKCCLSRKLDFLRFWQIAQRVQLNERAKTWRKIFHQKNMIRRLQKNENENVNDNIQIHIYHDMLMIIYIAPCIGNFYSFFVIVTMTVDKVFSILRVYCPNASSFWITLCCLAYWQ